jgi:hypothetical protein
VRDLSPSPNSLFELKTFLDRFVLVKSGPSTFAKLLSMLILSLSVLRSVLVIPLPPHLPPIPFNLGLAIPLLLYALYLSSSSGQTGWEEALWSGFAPLGAILLRVATEWEGERTVAEVRGLEGLMYDSPEA